MKFPKLLPNWKCVARRSFSFWLSLLASVLGAIEFALPFMAPTVPSRGFAAAACMVALSAAVSRLFLQRKLHEDDDSAQ